MLARSLALLAAAWLVNAQNENDYYNNFGSVVFVRSGERTPTSISKPGAQVLTSVGAQQMHELGSNFRRRYITTVGSPRGLGVQNIIGMSPNVIKNDQVLIQTLDKPYLVSSAQAFMQGLYPPSKMNITQDFPFLDATYGLADGTNVDYPMDGYQYPHIQVLGELDPQSIYLAGEDSCPAAEQAGLMYEITQEYVETRTTEKGVYKALNAGWFGDDVANSEIDYRYAIQIYDHLSYAYTHNKSVHDALENDTQDLYNRTRFLADEMAYYKYANTTTSSTDTDYQAMAGRTLSALLLGQLQKLITKNQNASSTVDAYPLSLLFGDFEPLTSFFNIAMVHQLNTYFKSIPPYASAMSIELYTLQKNTSFPDNLDNLYVSFYFHNGTDAFKGANGAVNGTGQIRMYSMFNQGNSQGMMKWKSFEDMMQRIMMNQASDWCKACNSPSLFCRGFDGDSSTLLLLDAQDSKKYKLSPAVAGVVGAMVTLAVAGILFAIAMLLGGLRFHRNEHSTLGGFKGSAKLASDPDLSLAKNAAAPAGAGIVSFGQKDSGRVAHERVGSWELRQKESGGADPAGRERDLSPRESFEAIEAAMGRPVQPTEGV
ncbi:phosphoglycerate mutase-like protein [Massarina eburnea CBS 473.64]|uniref:Phosphoglycerate mutase-like protein n=1 Tax=Massarina eburnea CBS 473.64 TaxID=1395130 RepID=A0A6A6RP06_9PLEO|nr:phosphoglycerate mutase-like protein [Massarina eburnea CBS 473.64]